MDNRLIFLYQSLMFERWGDAGGYERMLMDMHVQAIRQGSRQIRFPCKLSCDVVAPSAVGSDSTLPRKASS